MENTRQSLLEANELKGKQLIINTISKEPDQTEPSDLPHGHLGGIIFIGWQECDRALR
jgi:hypothetical protein